MQQHKQHRQAQHIMSAGVVAAALSALAVLLAALALIGPGGSVYAEPYSGGPTLDVTNIAGNTITVMGAGWSSNETITLGYSTSSSCLSSTVLSASSYAVAWDGSNFQLILTWPSTIGRGVYYLCASGSVTSGPVATPETVIVNTNGSVQPTPGSTTPPNATTTGTPTPTGTPGHNPGSTATKGTTGNGSGGDSNPGNKGASASTSVSSLVAIILLCLLVLALLVYLIRIWLQGRQAGSPPTP
ncbi:MAG TPA: hypothetical protein VFU32_03755 [Ktedonobacterales bacterium]|nr:hypothetical protein [Ktedonobacterales bacterium]